MSEAAHILIVDDDDRIRSLVKRFLARTGLRVTTASDAAPPPAAARSARKAK